MPALEIVALDTATPQLEVPQSGDTYSAPRALAISPQSLTGTSATTSLDIAQTWNTTGTPTAVKLNVTDTASNAASLLMDLQVGGASRFKVLKTGGVNIGTAYASIDVTAGGNLASDSTIVARWQGGILRLGSTTTFGWASTASPADAISDTVLVRDAANTLAQRNGVNAQTFRVYNTFTDASNYERGVVAWSSNALRIATENAGTGSSRTIQLYPSSGNVDIIDGSSVSQISFNIQSTNGLRVASDRPIGFTPGGANSASPDTTLRRVAAGILGVRGGLITDAGALSFIEQTAPAAPAANGVYIYAEDNGAGKTRLMARFATGAAQQIAIEP